MNQSTIPVCMYRWVLINNPHPTKKEKLKPPLKINVSI